MKIGQISFNKISELADYLQLDICGYNKFEVLNKYLKYNTKIPVILHGDWTKKGNSENNLEERYLEYINIINLLKTKNIQVLGFTLHPTTRKKLKLERIVEIASEIKDKTEIDVFIENRSNNRLHLSKPKEIIDFSQSNIMTIDIPQLYISCGYNQDILIKTLSKLNKKNIKEIHLGNIRRDGSHTYVGVSLEDKRGELDIKNILKYLPNNIYYTLELLGGVKTFSISYNFLIKKIK